MGVVEKHIGRVRGQVAEIVDGKLFQGHPQGSSVKMVGGKTVRLILILAGEAVHGQPHESGERRVEQSKAYQGQMEAMDISTQGRREHRVGNKQGQDIEHDAGLTEGENNPLDGVLFLIMADLMGQYRHQFLHLQVVNQGIIEDDALFGAQAGKIGISLGGTAGAVNDKDIIQLKAGLGAEGLDCIPQLTLLERCLLVKEGHDQGGVEHGHTNHEATHQQPGVDPEIVLGDLVKPDHCRKQRPAQEDDEEPALDLVGDKGGHGGLVKGEALLKDKGVIELKGQKKNFRGKEKQGKKEQGDQQLRLHHTPSQPVNKGKAATHEQGQEEHHLQAGGDQLKPAFCPLVLLGLLILLLAVNPLHLIRQLRGNTPTVEKAEPPFQEIIRNNDGDNDIKDGGGAHGMFLLNIKLLSWHNPGVLSYSSSAFFVKNVAL